MPMRKGKYVPLMMVGLFLMIAGSFADEGRVPPLWVVLPRIGSFSLGEVTVSLIPSPMVRMPDQPKEGQVIPEERQKEWEAGAGKQWLRLELKRSVVIEFSTTGLGSYHVLHSRSLYVSPTSDDDKVFGKLTGAGLGDIYFRYFTINVDAEESEKIEAKRNALVELGKNKNRIRLRGRFFRIETSAIGLFSPGIQKIDFLDFFIRDVEFVKY